jgi:hypothetical protein
VYSSIFKLTNELVTVVVKSERTVFKTYLNVACCTERTAKLILSAKTFIRTTGKQLLAKLAELIQQGEFFVNDDLADVATELSSELVKHVARLEADTVNDLSVAVDCDKVAKELG